MSASNPFHHTAPSSHAAAPVPAITGATALGNVRGRAPSTHCARVATPVIVAWTAHPDRAAGGRRMARGRIPDNERMLAVIGGSGFYTFFGSDARSISVDTPYGAPSGAITVGTV